MRRIHNIIKIFFMFLIVFISSNSIVLGIQSPDKQFEISMPDGWKSSVMREGDRLFYIMLLSPPPLQAAMQAVGDKAEKSETLDQIMQKIIKDLKSEYPDYTVKKIERTPWKGVQSILWHGTFKNEEYQAQFNVRNLLVIRNGKFYRFAATAKIGDNWEKLAPVFEKWIGTIQWH